MNLLNKRRFIFLIMQYKKQGKHYGNKEKTKKNKRKGKNVMKM